VTAPPLVMLAAGGTGGHLFPGIAIAEAFRKRNRDTEILFIGTERGLNGTEITFYGSSFIADPTGAIMLDRLPKLYPKGTILQLKGVVNQDENGLPLLTNVEIISAKP